MAFFRYAVLCLLLATACRADETVVEDNGNPIDTSELPNVVQASPLCADEPKPGCVDAIEEPTNGTLLQSNRGCCSPDLIIIIDITDGIGFSRYACESHIREFLLELLRRTAIRECDEVRAAIVEYGSIGRIRFSFNKYTSVSELRRAFSRYTPGSPLGPKSNALAGFTGANILLSDIARGRRPSSYAFVFWLVHSTPVNAAELQSYVKARVKPQAYVVVVAVGYNVNFNTVKSVSTRSTSYAFWVADILHIKDKCNDFHFNYCPVPKTTTRRITTTTQAATTTTRAATTTTQAATTTTTEPETTTTEEATTTTPEQRPTTPVTTRRTTTTTRAPTTTTRAATTTTRAATTTTQAATTTTRAATTTTQAATTTTRAATTTTQAATTTTRRTTTIQDVTTPLPPSDFCFQCRTRRNHKDLYADNTDCHFYYQCFYYNETYAVGIRRRCAAGTFWHDDVLQCMPEGETPCVDPCLSDSIAQSGCYAGTGCRQFFVCANTASYGMCCPPQTRFNAATCSCDDDLTCTSNCVQQGAQVATTVAPPQQFNATVCRDSFGTYISSVPNEANAYWLLDEFGLATEKLYCPETISFDLVTCRCDIENGATLPPSLVKRQAILWVPFDVDSKDHSHNKFATFLYDNVIRVVDIFAHGGGSLNANGGYVSIPGLKTYDLRNEASWCLHFRCEGNDFSCIANGGLLSNNKDASATEFTVILAALNNNAFTGRVNFWSPVGSQSVNSALTAPSNGWNHVCVTYDRNALRLYLNGAVADTEFIGGYLSVAHCPYVIAHDQFFGYFNGHIDDVLITPFAMTVDEITAHRNGDRTYLRSRGFFP